MLASETTHKIGYGRLSSLMFFQLFAFGAVLPFMSYYLTQILGFSGIQTGIILAITAVSNLIGPFLSAYVIDRKIHAKHIYMMVMVLMAVSSVGLMFVRDFWPVMIFVFFTYLSFGPALNIVHSVTFQDMKSWPGGTNRFGAVRVWGTISWIICGFLATGMWLLAPLVLPHGSDADFKASSFILAFFGAIMCIVVFVKIPKGQLNKEKVVSLIPKEAFAVIKKPLLLGFGLVFTLSQIFESFYYFGQGPYLRSLNVQSETIPAVLTVGQLLEIPMLFFFSRLLNRVGFYWVFVIGALAQFARYILFVSGSPVLGITALALNGIVFACIVNAITMFIDKHATDKSRNGVHQLIGLFFGGTSWLVGNLISGLIFDSLDKTNINFTNFWIIPLFGSILVLILVVFILRKATLASPHNFEAQNTVKE